MKIYNTEWETNQIKRFQIFSWLFEKIYDF